MCLINKCQITVAGPVDITECDSSWQTHHLWMKSSSISPSHYLNYCLFFLFCCVSTYLSEDYTLEPHVVLKLSGPFQMKFDIMLQSLQIWRMIWTRWDSASLVASCRSSDHMPSFVSSWDFKTVFLKNVLMLDWVVWKFIEAIFIFHSPVSVVWALCVE